MTTPTSGFDFDREVDRTRTASLKWEKYGNRDIMPLWVADTDFLSPPAVREALHERVDHGVFGYTLPPRAFVDEILGYLEGRFHWEVDPEWIVWLPGLVSGISVACRACAQPGESVLTSTPIYPPFLTCPVAMERELQTALLTQVDGRWTYDWDAFEAAIDASTRLYLFCSPHNPCGRIWESHELERMAAICARHDLVICSDEIHCALLLDDRIHRPTATLSNEIAARTVTLMAPSKTYNIAGLGCSYAIIPDAGLRRRYQRAAAMIVPHVNALGFTAGLAAYRDGGPWLEAQLQYLREGRDLIETTIAGIDGVSVAHVEGTYLAFLDCRELGIEHPARYFEEFGLGFQAGRDFGLPGFVRWNFGTTHARLKEALERFERGCAALR